MKKPFIILALIMFGFLLAYSIFYYTNYQPVSTPLSSMIHKLDATDVTYDPQQELNNNNLIYTPGFQLVWQKFVKRHSKQAFTLSLQQKPPKLPTRFKNEQVFPNPYLIGYEGLYNDSAENRIKALVDFWFEEKYTPQFKFRTAKGLIFSYTNFKMILENKFRLAKEPIEFKDTKVRTLNYLPPKSSKNKNVKLYQQGDFLGMQIQVNDSTKIGLVQNNRAHQNTLLQAYKGALEKMNNINKKPIKRTIQFPAFNYYLVKNFKALEPITVQYPSNTSLEQLKFKPYAKVALMINAKYNVLQAPEQPSASIKFNKPFLLYIKHQDRSFPWLLQWVHNSQLMIKSKS